MQAVVLVGGLGTRLGALLAGRNKPMVDVAGHPFIYYLLRQLRKNGLVDIVLCVGHRGELIRERFGSGSALGVRLRYSTEETLRGTAGALKLAEHLIHGESFLAMNGDSLFDVPLEELIAFHQAVHARVSVALASVERRERFGTVEVQGDGQVVGFREKGQASAGGYINGGIYVFQTDVLRGIPADQPVSLEQDVFPGLVGQGLYARAFPGYFVDIGVPDEYHRIQADPTRLLAAST
jgi:D-glycero-alpha-D-manno-heptose 1-phosphate guanylyltransferase